MALLSIMVGWLARLLNLRPPGRYVSDTKLSNLNSRLSTLTTCQGQQRAYYQTGTHTWPYFSQTEYISHISCLVVHMYEVFGRIYVTNIRRKWHNICEVYAFTHAQNRICHTRKKMNKIVIEHIFQTKPQWLFPPS